MPAAVVLEPVCTKQKMCVTVHKPHIKTDLPPTVHLQHPKDRGMGTEGVDVGLKNTKDAGSQWDRQQPRLPAYSQDRYPSEPSERRDDPFG